MSKVKDLLRADNWCCFTGATDQGGFSLNPRHKDACKFCLAGAIFRCYTGSEEIHQLERAAEYVRARYPGAPKGNVINVITGFNDYLAKWSDIETLIKELDL